MRDRLGRMIVARRGRRVLAAALLAALIAGGLWLAVAGPASAQRAPQPTTMATPGTIPPPPQSTTSTSMAVPVPSPGPPPSVPATSTPAGTRVECPNRDGIMADLASLIDKIPLVDMDDYKAGGTHPEYLEPAGGPPGRRGVVAPPRDHRQEGMLAHRRNGAAALPRHAEGRRQRAPAGHVHRCLPDDQLRPDVRVVEVERQEQGPRPARLHDDLRVQHVDTGDRCRHLADRVRADLGHVDGVGAAEQDGGRLRHPPRRPAAAQPGGLAGPDGLGGLRGAPGQDGGGGGRVPALGGDGDPRPRGGHRRHQPARLLHRRHGRRDGPVVGGRAAGGHRPGPCVGRRGREPSRTR